MMSKEHTLILIVGKTGSGKSSLIDALCNRRNFKQLISQTTRPRRNDTDNDHIFVTVDDYLRAKENNEIIAETEIAGNYYYATKEQLYEADLYTIDPRGREMLLSMDLPNIRFVTVYISCPNELRMERVINKRKDNKQAYSARSFSERQQFKNFISNEEWDYSIKNIEFAKAYSVLYWITQVENLWKNHMEDEQNGDNV